MKAFLSKDRQHFAGFVVLAAFATSSGETAFAQDGKREVMAPRLPTAMQVLEWLPPNTETLIVTKGPYRLKLLEHEAPKKEECGLARALEGLSAWPLAIREGKLIKLLAGQDIALAVEGARDFDKDGGGLGMQSYRGCHILVFQRDLGPAGNALTKALKEEAKSVERIGGHEVICLEEKLENTQWSFFLTQPSPNVLFCATNKQYLREVLERMNKRVEKRAFAPDLEEWKHVDTNARFWAIRHGVQLFPQDPLGPPIVSLAFSFDPAGKPREQQVAKVIYRQPEKNSAKDALKLWTYVGEREWKPTIRQVAPGIIEVTAKFPIEGDETRFLYALLLYLGHAIGC